MRAIVAATAAAYAAAPHWCPTKATHHPGNCTPTDTNANAEDAEAHEHAHRLSAHAHHVRRSGACALSVQSTELKIHNKLQCDVTTTDVSNVGSGWSIAAWRARDFTSQVASLQIPSLTTTTTATDDDYDVDDRRHRHTTATMTPRRPCAPSTELEAFLCVPLDGADAIALLLQPQLAVVMHATGEQLSLRVVEVVSVVRGRAAARAGHGSRVRYVATHAFKQVATAHGCDADGTACGVARILDAKSGATDIVATRQAHDATGKRVEFKGLSEPWMEPDALAISDAAAHAPSPSTWNGDATSDGGSACNDAETCVEANDTAPVTEAVSAVPWRSVGHKLGLDDMEEDATPRVSDMSGGNLDLDGDSDGPDCAQASVHAGLTIEVEAHDDPDSDSKGGSDVDCSDDDASASDASTCDDYESDDDLNDIFSSVVQAATGLGRVESEADASTATADNVAGGNGGGDYQEINLAPDGWATDWAKAIQDAESERQRVYGGAGPAAGPCSRIGRRGRRRL